jgi:WD40 repeat protein
MARRSAELAIVRDSTRGVQSVASPAEPSIRALENEINSLHDQPTPAFLKHVVARICLLTQADGVAVAVCDQWGVICRGSTGDAPEEGSRLRPDSALTRACFETGQLVICDDTETDYRVAPSIAQSLRLRSAVVVPLRTGDTVLGVLEVLSSRAFAFDRNHVASLQRIAAALGPTLASERAEEPSASIAFPLAEASEEPNSKAHKYLAAAAALLLLLLSLLSLVMLNRFPGRAPSATSPPPSAPVNPTQPTIRQQATQAEIPVEPPGTSPGSSHPDLPAPTAPSSLPAPWARAESNPGQPERSLTSESKALEAVRPSVPALVILGAPPGAQIFVDDHPVASINSDGEASISILAAGPHRLRLRLNGYLDYDQGIEVKADETSTVMAKLEPFQLPASYTSPNAPLVAVVPATPAPVISMRTGLPDFVLARTLKGHSGWVTTMAFSPDGQRLATGSWDQTVKLWEVSTGEQLTTVAKKNKEIQALAFSRDGRWLATENSSNTVTLRDAATGQEVRVLPSDKPLGPLGSNWVYSISFSPDGRWLATGVDEKTVRMWDVNTGTKLRDFTTSRRRITYIAFSPDSRLLASGDDDKTIRIWDVASGDELRKLSGHRKSIYAVAFSPNGRLLASASGDKTVRLWDVDSGREIHSLTGHGSVVTSLAFSPDGRWLVSGSWDKTVKIWEVETGREVRTLSGHDQPVYSVAFDSRGRWLASGSEDGTIKIWRLAELTGESRMP